MKRAWLPGLPLPALALGVCAVGVQTAPHHCVDAGLWQARVTSTSLGGAPRALSSSVQQAALQT